MTFTEYSKLSARTQPAGHDSAKVLTHGALGITTEAAEIADIAKKHVYYGKPVDIVNLKEEIGDVLWYLALIMSEYNITLEECMSRNVDKLRVRYPEKFTEESALTRDLDAERKILEQ